MMRGATNRKGRLFQTLALLQAGFFLVSLPGCQPMSEDARVARIRQAVVGKDGARTIATAGVVVNAYAQVTTNAAAGATTLTVAAIADLSPAGFTALAQGDLLLVMQMAGASIDTTNTVNYGAVTAYNQAGRYEFVGVEGVSGNTITVACPLKNSYTAAGKVQVIRVPQYTTLTVASGASIVASPWDGIKGGVVAVHAQATVSVNGQISATGLGFRGGAVENNTAASGSNITLYRDPASANGAEKGEGIAGSAADYDLLSGRYGRGAPANGGGGGNSHNGAGGGGANARSGLTWTGQGVMLGSVTGAAAWTLDPGYIANGNALTNSEGGGRGGYTYSNANQNALTVPPGDSSWGGDNRREAGGLGGRPLDNDPATRLFMGGGGGAGDGNNNSAGGGGNGGGLVFLMAGSVTGTGSVLAQGAAGGNAGGSPSDAGGGGGGGGSVIIFAPTVTGITVNASGGPGGNQTNSSADETEGPGGGGGGGYIAVSSGAASRIADGGAAGTTNRPALTEFPTNGATNGNGGQIVGSPATILYCGSMTVPETTIVTHPTHPTNQVSGTFTFASDQPTATFSCALDNEIYQACGATTSTGVLAEGSHTLRVRAVDSSGSVDPTPAVFTWTVDTTPPETSLPIAPTNPSPSTVGTFTFSSNEIPVTFECALDGGAFAVCPAVFTTPTLTPGPHVIQVRAKDAAGNLDPTPIQFPWTVLEAPDASAPDAPALDASAPDTATVDTASEDAADGGDLTDLGVLDTGDTADTGSIIPVDTLPDVRLDALDVAPADGGIRDGSADLIRLDALAPDTRPAADTLPQDTAVAPLPDAAVKRDAAAPVDNLVVRGGGFCTLSHASQPSTSPFLLLLGVAGFLLIRRRRR